MSNNKTENHVQFEYECKQRKAALITYLKSCIVAEDWHGVRDAAADIEVMQGKLSILTKFNIS